MSLQCPSCLSLINHKRKSAIQLGAALGVAFGVSCAALPPTGKGIPARVLAKAVFESLRAGIKGGLIGAQMGEHFEEQFPASNRCPDCGNTLVEKQALN
jgi:hypothetical protein